MKTPLLKHACDLIIELGNPMELGSGRAGTRRIIPITGGTVTGPDLNGEIIGPGADWQTVFDSGLAELDTRYSLKTHDDALIEIRNYGFRHGPPEVLATIARGEEVNPDTYYMRTHARLETGDERYDWVNNTLFVGTGHRLKDKVLISLYALL